MRDAYYHARNGRFEPTELTRGPWSPDAQHGGPPAALLAHHLVEVAADGLDPARITVELLRPIPLAPLRVSATVTRPGRNVNGTAAELWADDTLVARAAGLHIRTVDGLAVPDYPRRRHLRPENTDHGFPLPVAHDLPGFPRSVEVRWEPGHEMGPGPGTVWMRTSVDTISGVEPHPIEWVLPVADCGNGISWWSVDDVTFVNPDLTVYLHRQPISRWIRISSHSEWNPHGIGLADSELADEHGPIGRGLQSLYLAER